MQTTVTPDTAALKSIVESLRTLDTTGPDIAPHIFAQMPLPDTLDVNAMAIAGKCATLTPSQCGSERLHDGIRPSDACSLVDTCVSRDIKESLDAGLTSTTLMQWYLSKVHQVDNDSPQ